MNNTNINDTVRIAKFIANSGYCSRRDAEELIFQGKVSVNGEIIYTPAFKVPYDSEVLVDGEKIFFNNNNEIYLYHKPKGLIVSKMMKSKELLFLMNSQIICKVFFLLEG